MPKGRPKKTYAELFNEGDGASQMSASSEATEDGDMLTMPEHEPDSENAAHASSKTADNENTDSANSSLILKELREFRKDNTRQLTEIHEDINSINKRIEEAEGRIDSAETRIQATEEAVTELLKLQIQLSDKLTDLEGRSRRENIRIYGVKEGAEENSPSVVLFVEQLLRDKLEIPATVEIGVERAHRALAGQPPPGAPPRSIVAKLSSYKVKEEILKLAWQKRGYQLDGKAVNLDHDYAPEVLKKRKEYSEAKTALKEKKIRFQTPFPAKLRVFYEEGTVLYGSAVEATNDMVKRGFPVTALKQPTSLLEQVQRLSWRTVKKAGNTKTRTFQEKLQAFRRQDQ